MTTSSSSEDEEGRSGTTVRRRRLRKNTTSIVTEDEELDVSQHEEEEEEEEDAQQLETQTDVKASFLGVQNVKEPKSSVLNKCFLVALIVALSMGFGHFHGKNFTVVNIIMLQLCVRIRSVDCSASVEALIFSTNGSAYLNSQQSVYLHPSQFRSLHLHHSYTF